MKGKLKHINLLLLEPLTQVGMIMATSLILYLISANYLSRLHSLDPWPSLISQSSAVAPRHQIRTGLFVNNFLKADFIKNEFEMLGMIWFELKDGILSLEQLEQVIFSKGEIEGQADLRSKYVPVKPLINHVEDRVYVQYPIRLKFISNLDHRLFPFDSHRIYLTLNHMYLNTDQFEFNVEPSDFVISPNLLIYGWRQAAKSVKVGSVLKLVGKNRTTTYPRVIYAIDFQRSDFKDIWLLLLPLLLTFFMNMFTFSYSHASYRSSILSIGLGTITATLAYRFVIDTFAPSLPYFMLIDWLFIIFLLLNFIVFLVNVFNFWPKFRGWMVLGLQSGLIVVWCGLLYWWA